MIVDVYSEKGKRGRKKKIVEEPPAILVKEPIEDEKYMHSLITKKERYRMDKYGIIGYLQARNQAVVLGYLQRLNRHGGRRNLGGFRRARGAPR